MSNLPGGADGESDRGDPSRMSGPRSDGLASRRCLAPSSLPLPQSLEEISMLLRKRLLEASLIPGLETGSDLGCKPRVYRRTRDGMLQALMFLDWAEGRHP